MQFLHLKINNIPGKIFSDFPFLVPGLVKNFFSSRFSSRLKKLSRPNTTHHTVAPHTQSGPTQPIMPYPPQTSSSYYPPYDSTAYPAAPISRQPSASAHRVNFSAPNQPVCFACKQCQSIFAQSHNASRSSLESRDLRTYAPAVTGAESTPRYAQIVHRPPSQPPAVSLLPNTTTSSDKTTPPRSDLDQHVPIFEVDPKRSGTAPKMGEVTFANQ
jgi:hypothetical protein